MCAIYYIGLDFFFNSASCSSTVLFVVVLDVAISVVGENIQ